MIFYDICKTGNIFYVEKYLQDSEIIHNVLLNEGLYAACSYGYKDIAELLIDKGADDFDIGLNYACEKGYMELVKLMIDKGAASGPKSLGDEVTAWNIGLNYACYGRHKDIIKLMIDKGATDFNGGMNRACSNGYKDIIELMISYGAKRFDDGLFHACLSKQKEIALLMIENGADINKCSIKLNLEDVYYLYQKRVDVSKKYTKKYLKCKSYKQIFKNTMDEVLNIDDLVKIVIEY